MKFMTARGLPALFAAAMAVACATDEVRPLRDVDATTPAPTDDEEESDDRDTPVPPASDIDSGGRDSGKALRDTGVPSNPSKTDGSADASARQDAGGMTDVARDASVVDVATEPGCGDESLAVGTHSFMLKSANGISYKYHVVVPRSYVPTKRTPVVLFWHALTSYPDETRSLLHVDTTAEERGTIVVHPESPDKSWDVGSCCTGTVGGKRRDEQVFVRELVAEVKTKVCADPRRIYTTGFSNGAMLSQMLACKAPDLFAAAVSMSGTLTIPKAECSPSRAIPLLMINGTKDPLVGYDSASLSGGLPASEAFTFWSEKNKCSDQPAQTLSAGNVLCRAYKQCGAGTEVGLCTITGMGHCVAGMKKESTNNCLTRVAFGLIPIQLGPPNDEIDGVDTALDFLLRWTLP